MYLHGSHFCHMSNTNVMNKDATITKSTCMGFKLDSLHVSKKESRLRGSDSKASKRGSDSNTLFKHSVLH